MSVLDLTDELENYESHQQNKSTTKDVVDECGKILEGKLFSIHKVMIFTFPLSLSNIIHLITRITMCVLEAKNYS